MRLAVIDFSSVSISLLVADIGGEKSYRSVAGLRRSVSILDYMTHDGNLSQSGIEKCAEEVSYLCSAAENAGAERISIIATASMRIIKNRDEVRKRITEKAGVKVSVLSGRDEAYADYMANREYSALGHVLMLDIGGVSAELADLSDPKKKHMHSLPIGPVALMSLFPSIYPDSDDIKRIRKRIRKIFVKSEVYPCASFSRTVITGNDADALYRIYSDFYSLSPSGLHIMDRKKVKLLLKHLVSSDERSSLIVRNAPERGRTVLPAFALLYETMKHFSSDSAIVSPWGVKEGYLRILVEG